MSAFGGKADITRGPGRIKIGLERSLWSHKIENAMLHFPIKKGEQPLIFLILAVK